MSAGVRAIGAWLLIAVGALIAALCGTCTLFYAGSGLVSLVQGEDAGLAGFILVVALVVGGIPLLIGAMLVRWGWRLLRQTRRPDAGTSD